MAHCPRLALPVLFLAAALPLGAYSAEPDQMVDYAPIMSRGFGISDEPSLLEQCGPDFEALRIFEHGGGQPIAIVRVENSGDSPTLHKRRFVFGEPDASSEPQISMAEWTRLKGLLRDSGFWTYKRDDGVWMPESVTLWIEACVNSEFRSISIYPERDSRMTEITDFLASVGTF